MAKSKLKRLYDLQCAFARLKKLGCMLICDEQSKALFDAFCETEFEHACDYSIAFWEENLK